MPIFLRIFIVASRQEIAILVELSLLAIIAVFAGLDRYVIFIVIV